MIDSNQALANIPLSEPYLGGNEWSYVKECLDSGWVSSAGKFVNRLEETLCERVKSKFGVATSSGTAALHLALRLVGVQTGEEVLVSNLTFVAPINSIFYLNALPVLIDCEPVSLQLDVNLVSEFLEEGCERRTEGCFNRKTGRRVAAILPVHLLGHPVDMAPLMELAERFGLPVVEDATESLGALYKGEPVGRHGTIACYSFNGNKIVTAGGGGMMVTNDSDLAKRGRYLSTQAKDDPLYYVHNEVGYNYRLTNLQSALAVAQLEQLDSFVAKRRSIAATYREKLGAVGQRIRWSEEQPWAFCTFWLTTLILEEGGARKRDELMQYLNREGVQARPLWNPNHRNPPARDCTYVTHSDNSSSLVSQALNLPSSFSLSEEQQETVCQLILKFLS